jgi:type IV secretion system protein VirB3
MDQSPIQEITIHHALHQPILVMGGERNLVMMLAVIAGVFIFSLAQLWAAVVGVMLWVFGQWGLAQLAKYDPMLSKTGKRHMQYKQYYPASATPFAPTRTIQ